MLTCTVSPASALRIPQWTQQQCPPRGRLRRWTHCQTEIREHVTVLEQATMAVFEGYLSGPLAHRAVYAVQRLLALTETLAWHEGTQVVHAMARLFYPTVAFGLIHALHLSELLAAFSREMTQVSAWLAPTRGEDAVGVGGPASHRATSGADVASATPARATGIADRGKRAAGTKRRTACGSV
jgi:hypothetical protein